MDFDLWDGILHHIYKHASGDAWFRPQEEAASGISSGVAILTSQPGSPPEYRVFPYETASLEPFEWAVRSLGAVVAVKVRSAAVHACLADVDAGETGVWVDKGMRIQVVETMALLPAADKEQNAAFIRDERVLVVWSSSVDNIIPACTDIEERLVKLLWRSRPNGPSSIGSSFSAGRPASPTASSSEAHHAILPSSSSHAAHPLADAWVPEEAKTPQDETPQKRSWFTSRLKPSGKTNAGPNRRRRSLLSPLYTGLATALAVFFTGNGIRTLLVEFLLTSTPPLPQPSSGLHSPYIRFVLLVFTPLLFCISLFFSLQIILTLTMAIGPTSPMFRNSSYFSSIPPQPPTADVGASASKAIERDLPHVTIQMPVYKESLDLVLKPSITSIKKAIQTYALQGGTASIFINDDGLRVLPLEERDERIRFYAIHGIAWVARPRHGALPALPHSVSRKSSKDKERDESYDEEKALGRPVKKGKTDKEPTFERRGRFKKASNMNYALNVSLKLEKHLEELMLHDPLPQPSVPGQLNRSSTGSSLSLRGTATPGMNSVNNGLRYLRKDPDDNSIGLTYKRNQTGQTPSDSQISSQAPGEPTSDASEEVEETIEERALSRALTEAFEESLAMYSSSPSKSTTADGETVGWTPWASPASSVSQSLGLSRPGGLRMGPLILLVDSDTVVPEDTLLSAAREFGMTGKKASTALTAEEDEDGAQQLAILQHESAVLQVANHYFENAIAYFTHRINRCISYACACGDLAPFVGHNAYLRWKALQDVAFRPAGKKREKGEPDFQVWSESNVSEDFDLAMRLLRAGWNIRWATYGGGANGVAGSGGVFREGVSLTVDDELNRWQKYAYGCSELLFNPFAQWLKKGPINARIREFVWSEAPLNYKISMLSYMFSYYGIAGALPIAILNYVLLGFMFRVDGFYMHSFEIFLATTVVFFGAGNLGYTLMEYRLGRRGLIEGLLENMMWIPFFFFFFGGLSIPLSQAILAHMFSYNISWSATVKEVRKSNFFREMPRIMKRFWVPLTLSFIIILGVVVLSLPFVGVWRVAGEGWAVIFPITMLAACHILFPIVLNPWLMVFGY